MSNVILADNGVSSGTSGIKTTGDTSGQLALQTTTSSGTATTALTIDNNQNTTLAGYLNTPNTFGFKNRIINGAMMIAQRGTSATWNAGSIFCVDRFRSGSNVGWGSGVVSAAQSTNAPAGFTNSLGLTVTTADALSGSNSYTLIQPIEANNIADLGQGASWAKSFTLSFWVYSSLTGTFSGQLQSNGSTQRSWFFTYSVPVANTWTYVTATITGDTGGTANWLTGNSVGVYVRWSLGCSSAYCTGTTGSWINNTSSYDGVTGQVNLISTNGATFYITGVQLEKGTIATSFDYRDYGRELMMCQRYLPAISYSGGTNPYFGAGMAYGTTAAYYTISFPVTPRVPPTGLYVNSAGYFAGFLASTTVSIATSVIFSGANNHSAFIELTGMSGLSGGNSTLLFMYNSSALLYFTGCEL